MSELGTTAHNVVKETKKQAGKARQISEELYEKSLGLASATYNKGAELLNDTYTGVNKKVNTAINNVINKPIPSKTVSRVSYWSGLGSIFFGFPANLIAIISGHVIEDRRKTANEGLYKKAAEDDLVPTSVDLKKSRIGLIAGYGSLIIGMTTLVGIAVVTKKKLHL